MTILRETLNRAVSRSLRRAPPRMGALALGLWLAPACQDEPCDLRVALPNIALEDPRGNLLPQATVAVTWTGDDAHVVKFVLTCGIPAEPTSGDSDTCAFTVDYAREPGNYGAGTLGLRIEAPGSVPLEKEYIRTVDGCEVGPEINEVVTVADDPDVSDLCAAMCAVDTQCIADAGWTAEECADGCVGDLAAGGDGDACRPAYAALYACLGGLSCPDYSAFVAGAASPCTVAEQHVSSCEADGPSSG